MAVDSFAQSRPKPNDPLLGPLVRLYRFKPSQLPSHPDLASQQHGNPPEIKAITAAILDEAETFMTRYLVEKFTVNSNNKQAPPSTAAVQLLSHDINASLPKVEGSSGNTISETWFARTSVHENAAASGTATWQEFDSGLRQNHSQHEKDYTPDVLDAHLVLDWSSQLAEHERRIAGWEDVQVEIREMVHHIPPPLEKRRFSVLVVTAKRSKEFIVVQLPLDLQGVSKAKYNDAQKVTDGIYVSIEHGELLDDGAKVRWRMATASDAGGVLPMWAQKLGVPGAVVKDVGLFIDWVSKKRSGSA